MAFTVTRDATYPIIPDGPYAREIVTVTTSGGDRSGSFTSALSRVEKVIGLCSWSVSAGNVVALAGFPADAVYSIEVLGYL